VYGVGQTAERGAERLFAHVPGLHSQERATRCHAADFGHAGEAKVRRFGDQRGEEGALVAGGKSGRDMPEVGGEAGPALRH